MFGKQRYDVDKDIVAKPPSKGVAPEELVFYNRSEGLSRIKIVSTVSRSDTTDTKLMYISEDGSKYDFVRDMVPMKTIPQGTVRDYYRISLICPKQSTGDGKERLLLFSTKALLPHDNPIEGMQQWTLWVQTSFDGGRTIASDEQIIQKGDYDAMHCLDGVITGKNCVMLGDRTQLAVITKHQKQEAQNNKILLGVQISNTDDNGNYYNPGSGLTFTYCALIHGQWEGERLEWDISKPVKISAQKSRRGLIEPAVIELQNGRILMVMRGSNQGRNDPDPKALIPGYRWMTVSDDGGYTFRDVQPWTFENGKPFYSPSSCSQLLRHSNGRIYWIGNMCEHNPVGNWPRYPLVIATVDEHTLCLQKDSVSVIATREKDESENVTYSNFYAEENRQTHTIDVNLTPHHRIKERPFDQNYATVYRVHV